MGYVQYCCTDCGEVHHILRSCGHRFCPTCGVVNTNKWAENTLSNLLNIKHHHVVVTLPAWLRPMAKRNAVLIYNLLFKASQRVIREWFDYKHHLTPGIISVLHTAGSDLKYHPHIHMIVTGGGMNDGQVSLLEGEYLFAQSWFKSRFRWQFQQGLIAAYDEGDLKVAYGHQKRAYFLSWLKKNNEKDWVVSIQAPLEDATSIVRYVGRYTKRACLSEYKIEEVGEDYISFRYNDYKNTPKGEKAKEAVKRLHYVDFLDRLLQHVPEEGFVQVRYYGIYSTSKQKLLPEEWRNSPKVVPSLLVEDGENIEGDWENYRKTYQAHYGRDPLWCEHCQRPLIYIQTVLPFTRKRKRGGIKGNKPKALVAGINSS